MSNEPLSTNVETPEISKTPPKGRVLFQKAVEGLKGEAGSVTLSIADLQQLIAASSNAGKSDTAALVEAILESRKPYRDPQRQKVMQNVRKKMREGLLREDANNELKQSRCPHTQGTLGRIPSTLTAIMKHTMDNGAMVGICLICQRIFLPHDQDYQQQMQRPSGCEPSAAGRRWVADQPEAIRVGFEGYKHHDRDGLVIPA